MKRNVTSPEILEWNENLNGHFAGTDHSHRWHEVDVDRFMSKHFNLAGNLIAGTVTKIFLIYMFQV